MPPRARKATATVKARPAVAPAPDPDEALAREINDPEADAAIDALDEETARQIAAEAGDLDDDYEDNLPASKTEEKPRQPVAAKTEPPAPPAPSPAVLKSEAAPLDPPSAPKPPAQPMLLPPPQPGGDILAFVNPDGSPLRLADAFDLNSTEPLLVARKTIEIMFRPPGVRTPLQQLRYTKGTPVRRATVLQMVATEAAIHAARGE